MRVRGSQRAGAKLMLLLVTALISTQAGSAQDSPASQEGAPHGVQEVRVPFASLKPGAVFEIGEVADWVQITDDWVQIMDDWVWVASLKPASIHRIDPKTNKEVAIIPVPGDPCPGLGFGFGSLWVPWCGQEDSLVRIDSSTNKIAANLPIGAAGPEGGFAVSSPPMGWPRR